jgi:hypothetical protein
MHGNISRRRVTSTLSFVIIKNKTENCRSVI